MVTQRDYGREAVQAARSVLVELMHVLGAYRKDIVLVGGWVPEFICPQAEKAHIGSMDVDLALDHRRMTEVAYRAIRELLLERGYEQGSQPFIFHRKVNVGDREVQVEVDLLGGEYGGTGSAHRTQRVQDVRVRKARGADLAFESSLEVTIQCELPNGATDSVEVRVASVVPFLVMKAMALDERLREKDAWDICYCLRHHPGGIDTVVSAFKPYGRNGLVRDGLRRLAKHFASVTSVGPTHVADFEEAADPGERERIRRDAFERVRYLLGKVDAS
jgi:hypothetical protein